MRDPSHPPPPPPHGPHHGHPDHHGGPPDTRRDNRGPGEQGPPGPPDTQFLDLEISKIMLSEAEGMVRDAARDLLRDAIRARIKERMGESIEAIGRLAADTFVDDILANLEIERQIDERRRQRSGVEARLREITAAMKRP